MSMLPLIGVDALASGWSASAEPADDGSPARPVVFVDLDTAASASPEQLRAAAEVTRGSVPMLAGLASRGPEPRLEELIRALTLTLAPPGIADRSELVPVEDVPAAAAMLTGAVAAAPRASLTLAQVLRQTEQCDVRTGLAAEAAAYSMLLAGREFAGWLQRRGQPREIGAPLRPPVAVEREGDRLLIALDRPERRNAMDAGMRDALVDALTLALLSPETEVELSGRGGNFSSGGDLDEFGTAREVDAAYLVRLARHPGWLLHLLGDRVVVRVHGACVGAGVEMPSLAHRVEADAGTVFSLPEVGMGVIPGAGGTVGIPRRIGRWRAAWLALTGVPVDAGTAHAWGLVDHVTGA